MNNGEMQSIDKYRLHPQCDQNLHFSSMRNDMKFHSVGSFDRY